MEFLQQLYQRLQPEEYPWLWEVFLIVLLTLAANYIARLLLKRLEAKTALTATVWDDALLAAAHRPLAWLIWVIGFGWALDIVAASAEATIFDAVDPVREVLIIALLCWFVLGLIGQVEQRLLGRRNAASPEERLDNTTVIAIGKLLRTAVVVTAGLVILQSLGFSISGVLAFGGIGGIAVGFAARDLLANFFGGLMIFMDRPFAVGDWVRSPDKEIEGTVEHIGWRLTRIRTFDLRPLYVPNAIFTQISLENPSRMFHRRIFETIGVRYDDARQMRAIVEDVREMLATHEDIAQDRLIMVNFNVFGASSLDFFLYAFTRTTVWAEFHRIKEDVLLKTLDIIHHHGADVAYPTSTLKLDPVMVQAGASSSGDSR